MNAGSEQIREVPVDVLPPLPRDAYSQVPPVPTQETTAYRVPFEGLNTFYHPASGVVILGLDWLAFGTDFLLGFLALPLICILSFMVSFPLVFVIQRKWSKDRISVALGKAFVGAFMVGLPFPVTGTLMGAAILALSGLPHHPVEMVKRMAASRLQPSPK
jgi:hypothetical protein